MFTQKYQVKHYYYIIYLMKNHHLPWTSVLTFIKLPFIVLLQILNSFLSQGAVEAPHNNYGNNNHNIIS